MQLLSSTSDPEATLTCRAFMGHKIAPHNQPTRMKKSLLLPVIGLLALGNSAMAQCPAGQTQVTVSITTDRYGDETTWTLTGPGGSPVYAQGGPYTTASANGAYPQTPVNACVPDGGVCIFTINDSYGDGICCDYGNGSYAVTGGGNTLATGGQFVSQQVTYFQTSAPVALDVAMLAINVPNVVIPGNQTITGSLRNFGTSAVTSFTLNYSINGGAPLSQPVTANVAVGGTYNFTHTTPWNATPGTYQLSVWASDINGTTDGNSVNDELSKTVNVATQSVQRTTLIEEFTSSTCGPCASFNVTFDPLLESLNTNGPGSNVAAIKYQMNWPPPGNDPSYNPDGNTRRGYYGVNGIPDTFLDGAPLPAANASTINGAAAVPAFVSMDMEYWTNGNQVSVTVDVTPYANIPGTHKLYIAATEDFYSYPASTTSQDEFHYAMRKMMPNGNGNNLSTMQSGQTQTVTQQYTFNLGSPAQGNYNLWGNSISGLTVVAFVQNTTTKAILQAAKAEVVVGVPENELDRTTRVFPNPTNGILFVNYELPAGETAQVEVFNMVGERVLNTTRSTGNGMQRETLDISDLSEGIYFVNISAGGLRATRKVTLTK